MLSLWKRPGTDAHASDSVTAQLPPPSQIPACGQAHGGPASPLRSRLPQATAPRQGHGHPRRQSLPFLQASDLRLHRTLGTQAHGGRRAPPVRRGCRMPAKLSYFPASLLLRGSRAESHSAGTAPAAPTVCACHRLSWSEHPPAPAGRSPKSPWGRGAESSRGRAHRRLCRGGVQCGLLRSKQNQPGATPASPTRRKELGKLWAHSPRRQRRVGRDAGLVSPGVRDSRGAHPCLSDAPWRERRPLPTAGGP